MVDGGLIHPFAQLLLVFYGYPIQSHQKTIIQNNNNNEKRLIK